MLPLWKETSASFCPPMARKVADVACLKVSARFSACSREKGGVLGEDGPLVRSAMKKSDSGSAAGQRAGVEAALIILRHHAAFGFITLVQEGYAEGKGHILKDTVILCPGNNPAG